MSLALAVADHVYVVMTTGRVVHEAAAACAATPEALHPHLGL